MLQNEGGRKHHPRTPLARGGSSLAPPFTWYLVEGETDARFSWVWGRLTIRSSSTCGTRSRTTSTASLSSTSCWEVISAVRLPFSSVSNLDSPEMTVADLASVSGWNRSPSGPAGRDRRERGQVHGRRDCERAGLLTQHTNRPPVRLFLPTLCSERLTDRVVLFRSLVSCLLQRSQARQRPPRRARPCPSNRLQHRRPLLPVRSSVDRYRRFDGLHGSRSPLPTGLFVPD